MLKSSDVNDILQKLGEIYPEPRTELNFKTPFELLIATILSAQTTDRQVNGITRTLFAKFSTPGDFSRLSVKQLEEEIKSCGLYKNKAKNIIETSRILSERYDSEVPSVFEDLVSLPGVGRKTANVVLANAFGRDVMAVDTHVFRVSNRLGLVSAPSPEKTEEELMKIIPEGLRNKAHHWLIFHGRNVCRAKKPKCTECNLRQYCRHYNEFFK
ncbi:MAG: endonuclease III [Firmicutes bacterium HGW-Firmicutes-14]|jgi:endonuclease-3|nr:MAG: endonuclease III [Firmicutes bacterium HGW-Firmicutes-14]